MDSRSTSTWRLHSRDGRLIAELRTKFIDMPWVEADVVKGPAWDEYDDLFAAEIRATERATETDDWTEADRLYEQVRSATVLSDPNGTAVPEYLLHIDDTTATWRWHDESFD